MANDKVKNVAQRVDLLIRGPVEELGYVLWDVEYKKEGSEYNLIVTIDKTGVELTLDDCVAVTDLINPILDEADPITDSYCLEVSSAGLERDLKKPEHFKAYVGTDVEVKLFAATDTLPKSFVATLKDYSDDEVLTLVVNDVEEKLERAKTASVKTVVNYAEIFKNN